MRLTQPRVVAHADWSISADKRWLTVAECAVGGRYHVHAPVPVGDPGDLPRHLSERAKLNPVLLGVDFPLGLPIAYARSAGVEAFAPWLDEADTGNWSNFFELCESVEDISLERPFYPRRPGGTSHTQLVDALGASSIDDLRRRCERKTDRRGAAAPLFWTLGAQQVGRAAISGWRDMLQPARRGRDVVVRLWPFEGSLGELLHRKTIVVAETYPAESAVQIGIGAPGRRWSKRRQSDRAAHAHALTEWARDRRVTLDEALYPLVRDGFGDLAHGEDQFDSLIGLAGMLDVVLGVRPEMPPMSNERRIVEGWILGQAGGNRQSR